VFVEPRHPAQATAAAPRAWGLAAAFDSPEALLAAARQVAAAGYVRAEAYTPFAVQGVSEALGYRRSRMPLIVLVGGVVGGVAAFFMQWFANVVHYPWNVGGRPPNSWPAFVPITFELTVLFAALSAVVGMLAANKLPQPYHPMFNAPGFDRATVDRFFLCVEASDPRYDAVETRRFLASLGSIAVTEVPA
jgi:hypothetical protein